MDSTPPSTTHNFSPHLKPFFAEAITDNFVKLLLFSISLLYNHMWRGGPFSSYNLSVMKVSC